MKLRVPFFKQQTDYTCGPASMRMILAFFGIQRGEYSLAHMMRTTPQKGTAHRDLIRTVNELGLCCAVKRNATIHDIRRMLSFNVPVLIDYTEPDQDEGHYSVVIGIDDQTITLNDPWNGADTIYSIRNFEGRWRDSITRSDRWMMVVSKQSIHFGKTYLPRKRAGIFSLRRILSLVRS